jgi:putative oxidoreductase
MKVKHMRRILTWVLSVLLAVAFLGAGLAKLTSQPMMVQEFGIFGLPVWFMYFTGILEIASAVLVLIPRFAYIGAGTLVCVMIGALFAHLTHGQAGMAGGPLILLIIASAVGTLRGWGRGSGLAVGAFSGR